jgi:circadian clock protein KaiC
MHELLTYLSQQGVTTILVLGQHGLIGDMRSDVDLSYLSDAILLFKFFESSGEIRTAISAVKSRTGPHEHAIREFRLTSEGLEVGEPLTDFEGVLTGVPAYRGKVPMLGKKD